MTAGGLITLTAQDEIGGGAASQAVDTVGALEIAAGETVDVSSTTAGAIVLDGLGALTLQDVDTVDGSIDVTAAGLLTATDVSSGGGAGDDVTLSTTTGGVVATLVSSAQSVSITADAGDVTLGSVTGTTTVGITATTGAINDADDDSLADVTAGGLITLTAQDEIGGGAASQAVDTVGALEIAAGETVDVSSTTAGAIVLDGLGALTLQDVDTVDGSIDVTAAGLLTATDVSSGGGAGDDVTLSTTTGGVVATLVSSAQSVSITADAGDVTLGSVTGTTTVGITATTGAINDADDDSLADVTAGGLITLTAQDEIGGGAASQAVDTVGALEIAAGETVDVSSTTAGAIVLDGLGALTLQDVDTVDGSIDVTAAGLLTATDVETLTDSDTNDINITTTAGGDVAIGIVTTGGTAGDVNLVSAGAITDTSNDSVPDIVADELSLQTLGGGIGQDANGSVDTNVNTIAINAAGGGVATRDIGDGFTVGTVNTIVGVTTDTGDVVMTAASPLTIDDVVSNTGGGNITLAAEGALATDDLTIDADITATGGTGNIDLYAGDEVVIGSTQAVTISAASSGIVTANAGSDYNNGTVQAGNADGDVTLSNFAGNTVTSVTGAIAINATDSITVAAMASVTSTSGSVTLTADSDVGGLASGNDSEVIDMSDGALIDAGSGDISLSATGNVTLGGLITTSASGSAITVTSAAEIVDGGSAHTDLTATSGTVDLNAGTGIGISGAASDTDIEISVDTLSADTTNGSINIDSSNTSAVTVTSLTTGTGDINFEQSGGGDVSFTNVTTADGTILLRAISSNLTVSTVSTGNDNQIDLITDTSGDLRINSSVNAGTGTVAINVPGRIDDATGDDTAIDIVAGTLNISNTTNIGTDIDDGLNVNVDVLTITGGSGDAFITEADGFAAGAVDQGAGTLTLDMGGALTDNDAGTTTNFTASTLLITGNNDVTSIETDVTNLGLTTATTSIEDVSGVNLNASTVSGSLDLTTSGSVTQSGVVSVTAATTIDSNDNDITLGDTGNTFSGSVTFNNLTTGSNLNIADSTPLDLQSGLAVGDLTVNAAGITQSGPLTAAGTTTLTATGSAITLDNIANDFQGTTTVVSADSATLVDQNAITLGGPGSVTNLLDVTADAIDIIGVVMAGSVDFDADGGAGNITDSGSGSLEVTGSATLAAQTTDNITLDNVSNEFSTVTITSADNVTLVDNDTPTDGIVLGASTVSGTLAVTTENGISQSGALDVTGTATFAGGGTVVGDNDIDLSDASNDFSTVVITSGGDVTVEDSNSVDLGNATVGGHYSVTAFNGIDVTGSVDVSATGGTLTFDASGGAGDIIDSTGNVLVDGLATLVARTADDITLDAGSNNFGSVAVTSADNVTLNDADSLELADLTVQGNLDITVTGAITESASGAEVISVSGTTTLSSGAANDISLIKAGHDFSTVSVTQANDVTLVDTNGINLGLMTLGGDLDVQATGITVTGAISALTADLDASGGDLTDTTGSLNLSGAGASIFTVTGTDVITLDAGANDFNLVELNAGSGAVTLQDTDNIILGASSMTGLLDVQAVGILIDGAVSAGSTDLDASGSDLTDTDVTGELTVTGNSVLTVTGANTLALDTGTNNFATVQVNSGTGSATVVDATGIILGASISGGSLAVSADSIDLAGSVVADSVNFDASGGTGNITDSSGDLTVIDGTTLTVGALDSIQLDAGTNDFDSDDSGDAVTVTGTLANLTLADEDDIVLGGATVTTALDVTAQGMITQTGTLSAFSADLDAGAQVAGVNDITLTLGNDFDSLIIGNGGDVTIVDTDALDLGTANVGGAFDVTAAGIDVIGTVVAGSADLDASGGDLLDSGGSLTITGLSNLVVSGSNIIELDEVTNDFGTITASADTGAITLVDTNGVVLGAITANSTLSVDAAGIDVIGSIVVDDVIFDGTGGDITDTGGDLTVSGNTSLMVTAGNLIDFDTATNDFGTVDISAGVGTVDIVDENDVTIGTSTLGGSLVVDANNVTVGGALSTGSPNFIVDPAGEIQIDAPVVTTIGSVAFANADTVDINDDITSAGGIDVSAVNFVQLESSTLTADGTIDLDGGGTLTVEGGGTPVVLDANNDGDIILSDLTDVDDNATVNLTLSAEGGVTTGNIDLEDSIGGTFGVLSIDIDVDSDGAETLNVNGSIDNVNALAISGTSQNETMNFTGDVTSDVGGISIDNVQTLDSDGSMNAATGLTISNATTLQLSGANYTASGGNLDLDNGVSTIEIDGAGTVTFSSTLGNAIELAPIVDAVDGAETNLVISSGGTLTTSSIDLDDGIVDGDLSISLIGTGDTATIDGAVSNIDIFTFNGTASGDTLLFNDDAQSGGTFTVSNVDTIQLASGADLEGLSVDLTSGVTELELLGLTSQQITSTGGDINIGDVTSLNSNLILNAGLTDDIFIGSYGGSPTQGDIQILNSDNTVFSGTVDAGTVTISNTSSSVTFGDDTAIVSLATAGGGYSINFHGTTTTIDNNVAFANSGGVTFGNDGGDDIELRAGATATAGGVNVSGSVRSLGNILTFGDLTVNNNASIDTTSGVGLAGAALNLTGFVRGTDTQNLSLDAGDSGLITITGAVDRLASLDIVNSAGVLFQGALGSTTPVPLTISDTRSGETITFQNDTHLASLVTTNTVLPGADYAITFSGSDNQVDTFVDFQNTGTLNVSGASTLFVGGASKLTGLTELGGNVRSTGNPLDFNTTELVASTVIDTTHDGTVSGAAPGGADITFGSLDGSGFNLDLNAGTGGTITVAGTLIDVATLDLLNASSVLFQGNTQLTTLTTTANPFAVSFTGNSNQIVNPVVFSNTAGLTFGDETSDSIQFIGGVTVGSATTIAGTVSTIGSALVLQDINVVDGTQATLETAGGAVTVTGNISDSVGGGSESLSIDTDGGNVDLGDVNGLTNLIIDADGVADGDITLAAVNLTADLIITQGDVVTFNAPVNVANAVLDGDTFTVNQGIQATGSVTVTNTGLFTLLPDPLDVSSTTTADGGFSTTGDLLLGSNLSTNNTNVLIGGALDIAQDFDATISTNGGSLDVVGFTGGTLGGGDESLTVDAGDGSVTFNDILGVNSAELTNVTIVDSGTVEFNEIDIVGALTQTNPAQGSTTFNEVVSVGSADLKATNIIINGNFNSSGALSLDAGNTISQGIGATLTVTGAVLDVTATDATLDVNLDPAFGINLSISDDATLTSTINDVNVSGSVAGTLDISTGGDIALRTDVPGLNLIVADATFSSDVLDISDLRASGDVVLNIGGDASLVNDQSLVIEGSVGGNLLAQATVGTITDSGSLDVDGDAVIRAEGVGGGIVLSSVVTIDGAATFDADDGGANSNIVTVDNPINIFLDTLLLEGSDITIRESGDTNLLGVSASSSLSITSTGNIEDDLASGPIDVVGDAIFDADGDVILGDGGVAVTFGTLELDAVDVEITEADDTVLKKVTVGSLQLTSTTGSITQFDEVDPNEAIAVTGATAFDALANITLGNLSNNFGGSLALDGTDVVIQNSTLTNLGVVIADSLDLTSQGEINDSAAIAVTGALSLNAGSQNITLDLAGTHTFGTISVDGGDVVIEEMDGSVLDQIIADEFTLTSGGIVTQTQPPFPPTPLIDVVGTLRITGDEVILDGPNNQFGNIDLTGDSITIAQLGPIQLENITAIDLTVDAGGDITQQAGSSLDVTGIATFIGTDNIELTEANKFGTVSLTGNTVTVTESDDTEFIDVTVSELLFTSGGDITSTGPVVVEGLATFDATGSSITLEDGGNAFGTINLIADTALIIESDDTELGEIDASVSFSITSGGAITDITSSSIVVGEGELFANGEITIGDTPNDNVSFLDVDLIGTDIIFTESDGTILGNVQADTLTLTSASEITQTTGSVINVSGAVLFDTGSDDITLENANNQFGSIGVVEAGKLTINETGDGTELTDIVTDELIITSSGDITDADGATIQSLTTTSLITTGNITLDSTESEFGELELEGNVVDVRSSDDIVLSRVVADSLNLVSDRNILDLDDALIDVLGDATFDAQQSITIGVANNIVRFGTISLDARTVEIKESDATVFSNVDVVDLSYTSEGDISQLADLDVFNISGDAFFEARLGNSDIILDNAVNDFSQITVVGADVQIIDVDEIEIVGMDADTISVFAGGDISDLATSSFDSEIRGQATFNANDGLSNVDLSHPLNDFGRLDVTALATVVVQTGDFQFDNLNVSELDVTADTITQIDGSVLNVSGQATLNATTEIDLTTGENTFGTLSITAPEARISENDDTALEFVQVGTLTLTTDGNVSDTFEAKIVVDDEINIFASGHVTLGDQVGESIQLGEVNIQANDVFVSEADAVLLGAIDSATLSIESASDITQVSSSSLQVAGLAIFNANNGNSNVTLAQNNNEFGSLSVEANDSNIVESSDDGVDLADLESVNLTLRTSGEVTGSGVLRVSEHIRIIADEGDAAITLNNENNNLNRVSVTGSDVLILNSGDTELVQIFVKNNFSLFTAGDVTDSDDDEIDITGLATIDAGENGDIFLGNPLTTNVQIGAVNLSGDRINLTQTEDVVIAGTNALSTFTVESLEGDIESSAGATLVSGEDARFIVGRENGIINLTASQNDFGELSLTAKDASVHEVGSIILENVNVSNLVAKAGENITNTDLASINVVLGAVFEGQSIELGGGAAKVETGTVSIKANTATYIEEVDEIKLTGLEITDSVSLTAQNRITDEDGAVINVLGTATLEVTGQPQNVILNGSNNVISNLNLTSTDAEIHLVGDTALGVIDSDDFVLRAPDSTVTVSTGGQVTVDQNLDIFANNVIFDVDSVTEVGDLRVATPDAPDSSVEIRASILPRIVSENPTNPFGDIEVSSPNIVIGAEGRSVAIVTSGDADGGAVTIGSVNDQGESTGGGSVQLIGDVSIDTTNSTPEEGARAEGADVRIVATGGVLGQIRAVDGVVATSLDVEAGVGNVTLGEFIQGDEIDSLTVASANDVMLDDVYVSGNTVDITASGDVTVTGVIEDDAGAVSIQADGNISVSDASAATDLTLRSSTGGVQTTGAISGDNVTVVAETSIVLMGSTTAAGVATLVSNDTITTSDKIMADEEASILATNDISLNSETVTGIAEGTAIEGGDVKITSSKGDITTSSIFSDGKVGIISVEGRIDQDKNTIISASGNTPEVGDEPPDGLILSAEDGIAIATVDAVRDVTLVITKPRSDVAEGDPVPTFSRVNDPIPLGQGEMNQDINSQNGSIVFLAPIADVGSAVADQNFVQRAGSGIFYGLEEGQFFSDDIGSTAILAQIPIGTVDNLGKVTNAATTVASNVDPSSIPTIPPINLDAFQANLNSATTSVASAGETSASSSSRSTAASQRDDEEKVEEVDEVAFQNLKNYDENPQGIRLPDDQSFAYDDEGNIYFMVTLANPKAKGGYEQITLYRLELSAQDDDKLDSELTASVSDRYEFGFEPSFYKLPSTGGDE